MQCLFYESASWPSEHCSSTELIVFSMLYNVDIVEIEKKNMGHQRPPVVWGRWYRERMIIRYKNIERRIKVSCSVAQ